MPVGLVHPGLIGLQAGVALEILDHRDAALPPRLGEVLVLEGVAAESI
jgi:hypothetical protein